MIRQPLVRLLAVAIILSLSGCWSRVEVNDLAIVSMMAVDQTEEGKLKLWLHVVVPSQAGGTVSKFGGAQASPFITLSAEGASVLEASRWIQTQLPRRLYWAHMRVILLGEPLARNGIRHVLDFLTRHREIRLTDYLLMVKGDVSELMTTQVDLELFPSEYLREIANSDIGLEVTIGDFMRMLGAEGEDPIMAMAEVVPPPPGAPEGQKSALRETGTALFRGDKLAGVMDPHITRGLLWLRGEVKSGVVTVEVPGTPGQVTMESLRSFVRRTARVESGRVVVHVKARTEVDISEDSSGLDLWHSRSLARIDAQLSRAIKGRMEGALEIMRELEVDPAGLGKVIHQQAPGAWKMLPKGTERTYLERIKVTLEVDGRVRRSGLSSSPRRGGIEEDRGK